MEYRLRPWVSWTFLQNNNHLAYHFLNCLMIVLLQKNSMKPRVAVYILWIKYIYLIYIYLSLLYYSSILDFERSPYYIALGSTHTHKVIYIYIYIYIYVSTVSRDCRIRRLNLCRGGKTSFPTRVLIYDTKLSDDEALVLENWGMWNTLSLPSLQCPFWSWLLVPVKITLWVKYNYLIIYYTWNYSTVCKKNS